MRMTIDIRGFRLWAGTLLLLIGAAAAVLATGCSDRLATDTDNPRLAWEAFMRYYSDGQYVSAFDLAGCRLKVSGSDFDDGVNGQYLRRLSETARFRFVSDSDVRGVKATQRIELTTLDMRKLVRNAAEPMLTELDGKIQKNGSFRTDEALEEALREHMAALLSDDCEDSLTTEEIRVSFRYQDGAWHPVMDKALYRALTGYCADSRKTVDEVLGEFRRKHPVGQEAQP